MNKFNYFTRGKYGVNRVNPTKSKQFRRERRSCWVIKCRDNQLLNRTQVLKIQTEYVNFFLLVIQRTISSNHLRMRKKVVFLGVRNSMNLDINLIIICALKWPMTRLCILNSSNDFRCCAIDTDNSLYPS